MKDQRLCGGRLDHIEIDETNLELSVVRPKTDRPIGRPWLTVVICAYSKAILGFYITSSQLEQSDCSLAVTREKEKV